MGGGALEKREPQCGDNQILACIQATGWTFPNGNYAFANTGPLELPWLGSVSQDQRSVMCWLFVCPPSPVWGNHVFCCRCIGNTIDGELPWSPYSSNQAVSSVSGTAQPGRHNSRVLGHQAETLAGSYKGVAGGFSESASIWRMEAGGGMTTLVVQQKQSVP